MATDINSFILLLRPHQWVKNGIIIGPLVFTPAVVTWSLTLNLFIGILLFCLSASAIYVLNDIIDREADRHHSVKKNRPIAKGAISVKSAYILFVALCVAAVSGALFLSIDFALVLTCYIILNIVYSLILKQFTIIDVLTIMISYVLRIYAGSALIEMWPGPWIIICTGLLALFLALAKRRDDLVRNIGSSHRKSIDGYSLPFVNSALTVVLSGLLASYAIYTTNVETIEKLGSDKLYLSIPFVLAGLLRYLQITIVLEQSGDPSETIVKDNFLRVTIVLWASLIVYLIYF